MNLNGMKTTSILGLLCLILLPGVSRAQFPEDALRYSSPGLGVGARSLALGTAYTGIANDFSAVFWNPAGLGQIRTNEFSVGLSNLSAGDNSTFFSNKGSFTNSSTTLNNLGLVYPFPTERGSLVFAVGYGRQADYTAGLSFSGFNPKSSIVQTWAPNGQPYPAELSFAEQLFLAKADTSPASPTYGKFLSPIRDSLTQSGKVLEGGGQNYFSLSGAVEAAKDFYLGMTLNFISGSYTYTRNYSEEDLLNVYHLYTPAYTSSDFKSLSLLETIEADISGFSAKMGLLYKFGPSSRVGLTVKTPSWITVKETFTQSGTSTFDDPSGNSSADLGAQKNEYDVVTPFVLSGGFSYAIRDLMLAGDIEYTDWTQMEFRNAGAALLAYNTSIKEIFRPTANLKAGAEYEFSGIGLRVRGGFAYLPSPYRGDPASFDRKYITGGFGLVVQDAIAIDIGYAYGFWKSYRVNYDATSRVDEDITNSNLLGTVSYRF